MNSKKNIWRLFAGKGYYIALILCAVAIGISGYLYYRNATNAPDQPVVNAGDGNGSDVQVMATQPTGGSSAPDKKLKTARPLSGQTVATFSMDSLSYNPTTRDWRVHNGIDIAAPEGTEVCAAADGIVYTIYEDEAFGTTVVLRHADGYVTMYASLDADVKVAAGDEVKLGQTLGYVGTSALLESAIGDHIHFCVTRNDVSVDPEKFLANS